MMDDVPAHCPFGLIGSNDLFSAEKELQRNCACARPKESLHNAYTTWVRSRSFLLRCAWMALHWQAWLRCCSWHLWDLSMCCVMGWRQNGQTSRIVSLIYYWCLHRYCNPSSKFYFKRLQILLTTVGHKTVLHMVRAPLPNLN